MTTTTSRRSLLAGAAALPLASLPAIAAVHPDAEVLRLYRVFAEADAAQEAHYVSDAVDEARFNIWETHYLARQDDALHALLNEPAHTLDGIKAKARAILEAHFEEGVDEEWEVLMHDILEVQS
jgi:hypothetical protein